MDKSEVIINLVDDLDYQQVSLVGAFMTYDLDGPAATGHVLTLHPGVIVGHAVERLQSRFESGDQLIDAFGPFNWSRLGKKGAVTLDRGYVGAVLKPLEARYRQSCERKGARISVRLLVLAAIYDYGLHMAVRGMEAGYPMPDTVRDAMGRSTGLLQWVRP